MKLQMVDLLSQYEKIREEIDAQIQATINKTAFINGPAVAEFQKDLASYLNVKDVIACGNGTDALQIALMALNLNPGDEVITSNFTFIATVEAIALLKLKPVLVDVDEDTFNISTDKIEAAIGPKTKAIIPVHLFGQPAEMQKIMEIAQKHRLFVIEDNAQAIGSDYTFDDGRKLKSGTIGHIGTTSFFPSKNLGCYGDGGALMTNDETLGQKLGMIINHGSKVKYYHEEIGVNSRLDTLQAAILKIKLKYLDEYTAARQAAADYYDFRLSHIDGIKTPKRTTQGNHVFHQYTLRISHGRRDQIKTALAEKGIPSMVYYPVPLSLQKAYRNIGYKPGDFPITEKLCSEVLSLPMHTELSHEQQDFIIDNLLELI